jgi:hypothetical protein
MGNELRRYDARGRKRRSRGREQEGETTRATALAAIASKSGRRRSDDARGSGARRSE